MLRDSGVFFSSNVFDEPDPFLSAKVPVTSRSTSSSPSSRRRATTTASGNPLNNSTRGDDRDQHALDLMTLHRGAGTTTSRAHQQQQQQQQLAGSSLGRGGSPSSSNNSSNSGNVTGTFFVQSSTRLIGSAAYGHEDYSPLYSPSLSPNTERLNSRHHRVDDVSVAFDVDPGDWKHVVKPSDTLQGIALHYKVTVEDIRRANYMWPGDSLHLKKALVIPRSKAVSSSVSSQPTSDSGNEIHNIPRSASVPDTRQSRVTVTYDVQNLFSKMDANVSNIESSMEAHPPSDVTKLNTPPTTRKPKSPTPLWSSSKNSTSRSGWFGW